MPITENSVPCWPVVRRLSWQLLSEGLKIICENNEGELFFQVLQFHINKAVYWCDWVELDEIWRGICWRRKRNFFYQELEKACGLHTLHSHLNSLTSIISVTKKTFPSSPKTSVCSFMTFIITWFNKYKDASNRMQKLVQVTFLFSQRWPP